MGQYHFIANLDKREFLNPHVMGDGLKLAEFASSGDGTMLGLGLLLACSNGRGGGDFRVWDDSDPSYGDRTVAGVTPRDYQLAEAIVGRWAGDRIAIIGDYAQSEDFPGFVADSPVENPWTDELGKEENQLWVDISPSVRRVIELDYYAGPRLRQSWSSGAAADPYATPGVLRNE